MSESPQKEAPKISKKTRRRAAPKSKAPAPPEFPDPELPDLIETNRPVLKRARGKGKRPIVPWPKFRTKQQTEFYAAMVTEAMQALSELTGSIAETPTDDPLAGIKASALAMHVSPTLTAWGRFIDTITVLTTSAGPINSPALMRKAATDLLILCVIARDD